MKVLVGSTGFVGGNLYRKGDFDAGFCSRNIGDAYGLNPDLLVYAGLPAEKYMANNDPERDYETVQNAFANIQKIHPKKLVLISTIDVFDKPWNVDETASIDADKLHPYGKHRFFLEEWVRNEFADALIIRLPGLFGKGIKKNFIYDLIHPVPKRLGEKKLRELVESNPSIMQFYDYDRSGFYQLTTTNDREEKQAEEELSKTGFSSIQFTDSRNTYQFYNLAWLWDDMNKALDAELRVLHSATEPVVASELYRFLTGDDFVNEIAEIPVHYDYHTVYASLYGGKDGYMKNKSEVMESIKRFVISEGFEL